MLQQRLQDLQILKSTATGNFRVLVPAVEPASPVSPKPVRNALLGVAVGLIAGIALALLLEQFDTRLRRAEDVARVIGQPIIGRVPRISRKLLGENAVVALAEPHSQAAEAFRLIRTNLDFMRVDGGVRSLLVTSCAQGEGKSVTVANLAASMALAGKDVIVVDGDLRRPRQHTYFGLRNTVGVSTVVTDQSPLAPALQEVQLSDESGDGLVWKGGGGSRGRLRVLTSGPIPPNPGEIVSSKRFGALVQALSDDVDLVLVDSPAMLAVGDTAAMSARINGLVFLVDMRVVRRPMLLQASDQLSKLPSRPLGIVLRSDESSAGRYAAYHYHYADSGNGDRRQTAKRAGASGPQRGDVQSLARKDKAGTST